MQFNSDRGRPRGTTAYETCVYENARSCRGTLSEIFPKKIASGTIRRVVKHVLTIGIVPLRRIGIAM